MTKQLEWCPHCQKKVELDYNWELYADCCLDCGGEVHFYEDPQGNRELTDWELDEIDRQQSENEYYMSIGLSPLH